MVLWFYVQEHPKAQPAVVLVLKRLRRRDNSFKSHPTDWEKPGIEPATPGLQGIGLSPTPRRLLCVPVKYENIWQDMHLFKFLCVYIMYENQNEHCAINVFFRV